MANERLVYDGLQQCPYLDGHVARMPLYRQAKYLGLEQADVRFQNQERRVGTCLYRPDCPTCSACRGIRIVVDDFSPTRSQRRVMKRWRDRYRIEYGPPKCSPEVLRMYNAHKDQRGLREDGAGAMTAEGYIGWLVNSCFHTMEMRYYVDDRLVGLGVLDLGATAASSVYFFFDPSPDVSKLSPGVFSVLEELAFCRTTGRKYLYLGLYVRDCTELSYKRNYYPHERVEFGNWVRYDRREDDPHYQG